MMHDHEHGSTGSPEVKEPAMPAMRQMMAKMKAGDADLNRLVTTMNAAKGAAQITAMADLLTRLVQQQTSMRVERQRG